MTWKSSNTTWATINSSGLATAVSPGPVTISATVGGITGSTGLTVTSATLVSIAVTPSNTSLAVGKTEQFTATGTLSDNSTEILTSGVTWKSSDTTWATINSSGLATAVSPGPVTISATVGGITGSTGLTVTAATLVSIAVTPSNTSLAVGKTEQFTATGTLSDNSTEILTSGVTWKSSDTTWATINSSGLATAVSPGPVTISATVGGITGSTGLTVTSATLVSIAVTPSNTSLAVGKTEQFTATGTLSDNSTEILTSGVTWKSSDTTWATINSSGLATAVSPGPVTISATFDGITGSTGLTVTAAPVLSPVAVKDNSLGGYYQYGSWTVAAGGYLGTVSTSNSSTASNRWMLTVPAGTYDIWASWVSAASNATNTGYSIYDGFTKLGTVQENQQLAAGDGQFGGVLWAKLGTYTVTNGTVTVALSGSGANGNIVADGIILTASTPVVAAVQSPAVPAVMGATILGAVVPIMPATTSDPAQSSIVAPIQTSAVVKTAAPATVTAITVKSKTRLALRRAALSANHAKTPASNENALHKVKVRQHSKAQELLIAHLAREQVSHKKPSAKHRTA